MVTIYRAMAILLYLVAFAIVSQNSEFFKALAPQPDKPEQLKPGKNDRIVRTPRKNNDSNQSTKGKTKTPAQTQAQTPKE